MPRIPRPTLTATIETNEKVNALPAIYLRIGAEAPLRVSTAGVAREAAALLQKAAIDLEAKILSACGLRLFAVKNCATFHLGEEAYIVESQESGVEVGLRAMRSDHPRASVGSEWGHFDFSFRSIARARLIAVDGRVSHFAEVK